MKTLISKVALNIVRLCEFSRAALPAAQAPELITIPMTAVYGQKNEKAEFLRQLGLQPIAGVAFLSVALSAAFPLFGQITPEQRLTEAYRLEREGKAAPAIIQINSLLDSKSLDPAGIGKAWNVLGLASEDQGDFLASRQAFEQSIQAYDGLPSESAGHAMALDDFGEFYVATGQLDLALKMMNKALHLYEISKDHAGMARAYGDLAGALFSQRKVNEGRKNLDRAQKESRLTNQLDKDDLAALASLQGWLARSDGDLRTSISKYRQSLDLLREYHGEAHASSGWGHVLLGQIQAETGDLSESLTEMEEGLAILSRTLNRQDPRFLSAEIAYSRLLDKAGRRSEAASLRDYAERQLKAFRECVDCTVSASAFR
jgi:tetratricopeptide (TPR) repeat protein